MIVPVNDLRNGRTFKLEGEPFEVVEYKHVKLGRGTATIKIKMRNLKTGAVLEKAFISGAKVEPVETETKFLQYLYSDPDNYYFMDPKSFEQISLPTKVLGDKGKFLMEGEEVRVLFWEDSPLSVELPMSLVFEVVDAPPGYRGDTVSASFKQVTLGNGLIAKVPFFIKPDDKVKIDTRTGSYLERVK